MSELTSLTLKAALDGLKSKSFSAVEITQAHVDAVAAARDLNAFILETPDARIAKGEAGALEGAPLGIKDLFAPRAWHTACSKILGLRAALRIDRHRQPVARRRRHARQAE
jgi:aspartyl-tRNA(Asn)/glutamyl-tRNA(Gln) amidotransferase subunit A